ncbi:MAG: hypothetical protein ACFFF4_17565 [Candidatus Thorarchaeota archaeon]
MNRESYLHAMELLDIDLADGKSRVLKGAILAQRRLGEGVTFDELRSKIAEKQGGKRVVRPLIYRYLKSLEESGFLDVDRSSNPNQYIVNISNLSEGIERSRLVKLSELTLKHGEIQELIQNLNNTTPVWLARDMVELLVGSTYVSNSRSAQGMIQIQNMINSEIYSRARQGDIIRCTLDWDFQPASYEEKNRRIGFALFSNKVKMRFLLHDPSRVDQALLADRIQVYRGVQSDPNLSEYAETRVTFKKTKTYQCVALNREGIVLIVSEDPYTGVWIPRTVNQKLVDEVVDQYDRDFATGVDLLEVEINL